MRILTHGSVKLNEGVLGKEGRLILFEHIIYGAIANINYKCENNPALILVIKFKIQN